MVADHFELFASPVRVAAVPAAAALNPDLAQALLAEAAAEPGLVRSNAGGWHSQPDLTLRGGVFQALFQALMPAVSEGVRVLASARGAAAPRLGFGIQAWAMVLRQGDWVVPHDHAESHFSAAWYVDVGDPPGPRQHPEGPGSGRLVFTSPVTGAPRIPGLDVFSTSFAITPEAGRLVLFPGYLSHYVEPYRGTRPRICVSFNLRLETRAG